MVVLGGDGISWGELGIFDGRNIGVGEEICEVVWFDFIGGDEM